MYFKLFYIPPSLFVLFTFSIMKPKIKKEDVFMFLLETFAFLCGVIVFGIAAKRGFGLVSKLTNKLFDFIDKWVGKIFGD